MCRCPFFYLNNCSWPRSLSSSRTLAFWLPISEFDILARVSAVLVLPYCGLSFPVHFPFRDCEICCLVCAVCCLL